MENKNQPLSSEQESALMAIGVYKNDNGEYTYGEKTDKNGNVIGKGTPITKEKAIELANQVLIIENKIPSNYKQDEVGSGTEALLKSAGYVSDDYGNYYKKDGSIVSPQELLDIAKTSNEKLASAVGKVAGILKECGVVGCVTNLDLHPKYTQSPQYTAQAETTNIFEDIRTPTNKTFNTNEMQKTIEAMNFLSDPNKAAAFDEGIRQALGKIDPDNFTVNPYQFSKTEIFGELISKFGDTFVKSHLINAIQQAHLNSGDPTAPSQFLMSELKDSIIHLEKNWKGINGEQANLACGADYDVAGNISPIRNSNGLTVGCAVQGRF